MASRLFLAWRMFNASKARDDRHYTIKKNAIARATFDPLKHLTDSHFRRRYRINKNMFRLLCRDLKRKTNLRSSQRISLETKVLTALFFYATGSYQRPVGVAKHVSQRACSAYIEEVTKALTHQYILNKYIKFPTTTSARQEISQRDYGIPGVIGCIDGSHFKIVVPPKEEEHWYYSRKHYHSLNVQMICDDRQYILNVNPKFGGANHDSFIWENSDINEYMQSLNRNGEMVWLLGDSGYPQRPWLMTPIADAGNDTLEGLYNMRHKKARVLIENTFSKLKNRWRCLHKDRVLHYKPVKCAKIILACAVLHNFCIKCNITDSDEESDHEIETNINETHVEREATTELIRGRQLRSQLVRRLQ